ncbi:MAG: hypothetical protein EG825_00630 [Rhodocyclaceae bacterium]|nr:hypothetical protein [Rhodocyclaceae bacterium]
MSFRDVIDALVFTALQLLALAVCDPASGAETHGVMESTMQPNYTQGLLTAKVLAPDTGYSMIFDDTGRPIGAALPGAPYPLKREEVEANAKLFAAANQVVEALREYLDASQALLNNIDANVFNGEAFQRYDIARINAEAALVAATGYGKAVMKPFWIGVDPGQEVPA